MFKSNASRLFAFVITISIFFSCNNANQKSTKDGYENIKIDSAKKAKAVILEFGNPETIDASGYVMYKMILNSTEAETSDGYGSSSRSVSQEFWNITFYNTLTGKYHLLTDKKMTIQLSDGANGDDVNIETNNKAVIKSDSLLYYTVKICDYNKDGKLDHDDPTYLFSSNKAGYNFKQISPDSLDVKNWLIIKSTNQVLMRAANDSNHDRKFDEADMTTPYIYDIKTGLPAKQVFSDDFETSAKRLLQKQWLKKID